MPPAQSLFADAPAPARAQDQAGVSSSGPSTNAGAGRACAAHPLYRHSSGQVEQARERLLAAQAAGRTVYRFESGESSFSVAPHVLQAIERAGREGKTHYIPNDGIPELRRALAEKVVAKSGIAGVTPNDVFLTNGA